MARMAKKRREKTPRWVKVVAALTAIGFIILCTFVAYLGYKKFTSSYALVPNDSFEAPMYPSDKKQKNSRKKYSLNTNAKAWNKTMSDYLRPKTVAQLHHSVELPLEVVHNRPVNLRPKNRNSYLKERIDRIERNANLLNSTQTQKKALEALEKRLKALEMLETLYEGGIS